LLFLKQDFPRFINRSPSGNHNCPVKCPILGLYLGFSGMRLCREGSGHKSPLKSPFSEGHLKQKIGILTIDYKAGHVILRLIRWLPVLRRELRSTLPISACLYQKSFWSNLRTSAARPYRTIQ
jgi:hypothetical protein